MHNRHGLTATKNIGNLDKDPSPVSSPLLTAMEKRVSMKIFLLVALGFPTLVFAQADYRQIAKCVNDHAVPAGISATSLKLRHVVRGETITVGLWVSSQDKTKGKIEITVGGEVEPLEVSLNWHSDSVYFDRSTKDGRLVRSNFFKGKNVETLIAVDGDIELFPAFRCEVDDLTTIK